MYLGFTFFVFSLPLHAGDQDVYCAILASNTTPHQGHALQFPLSPIPLYPVETLPLHTCDSGKTVTPVWTRPRDRIYSRVAAFFGGRVLCWSTVRWKPAAVMTTHPDFCCVQHVHLMERQ